jgi:tetratricopeptide (TPR) repeat protein
MRAVSQPYDPQSGQSPLVLLQVPQDGVGYFRKLQRARELNAAEQWAEAEPLWEALVREYPRCAECWMLLGRTKLRLKKGDEAAAAYRRAGPLIGWDLEFANGYRAAAALLQAGHRKEAFDQLREMIFQRHGFWRQQLADDWSPYFDSVKSDPEFRDITGWPDTSGWKRVKGWRYDLDFLYNETKRVNPDYRDLPFLPELERRYRALERDVPRLSDEEIYFRIGRMLAPLHQGHVSLFPLSRGGFLPLRFYAFPEGVFIIEAKGENASLNGARVLSIGSLPVEEAWRRLAESASVDGDMQHVWEIQRLAEVANLKGMGAVADSAAVPLTIEDAQRNTRTVTIASTPEPPSNDQSDRTDRLIAPPAVAAPLFLSRMRDVFWHQLLPQEDALYVQVNNLIDSPNESLAAYGKRLWGEIEQAHVANLILDLRHNNGGTTQDYPELLRSIVAFSRVPAHTVYVLIGRRSYSATGNFVTDLERLADPIFVGEASSECCNLYGDPIHVTLPYSRVELEVTAVRWQLSSPSDRRREISPEVPVQLTAADYFAGRDPALDAIFELIGVRPAER